MKMKAVFGYFSAVVVSFASVGAPAQEIPGLHKSNKMFSVLYSSSAGKALIGVIDNKNVAGFAECDAPRGGADAIMALTALSGCSILEGSQFF